ncbi:hypothetical protein HMPREF9075_00682 [Capnocytophaga sp. oral taxon 332 str. F0381]|nr:hypothetical protein HMPREF9075_00682 [Capnocytophaga sp. oral taxon 332 str. F0381]
MIYVIALLTKKDVFCCFIYNFFLGDKIALKTKNFSKVSILC